MPELNKITAMLMHHCFPAAQPMRVRQIAVLAHIHCLPSTIQVVRCLLELGIRPEALVIIPKPYSLIASAVEEIQALGADVIMQRTIDHPGIYDEQMRRVVIEGCNRAYRAFRLKNMEQLVLIDDGGLLSEAWYALFGLYPGNLISIQQTTSGVGRPPRKSPMQKIDVARSAAKRIFESAVIVDGILRKVTDLQLLSVHDRIGVIGVGTLGRRLARHLIRDGKTVFTYDLAKARPLAAARMCHSHVEVLKKATLVFGCTGKNWLTGQRIRRGCDREHTFVSCSSRSVEFYTLLRLDSVAKLEDPFGTVTIELAGLSPQIVANGGFPINFDRRQEWERDEEIFLTRGLIMLAFLQAVYGKTSRRAGEVMKLDAAGQRLLVTEWLDSLGKETHEFGVGAADVANEDWWRRRSHGS